YCKGIFSHEYINSHDRFKKTELSPIHEFHSVLRDVLNLADIWTIFRKTSMHHYSLDPNHYVSASSLSWDTMLKMTK
ncbi:19688_t:CDS:2, partial [Funneliformis geosporum]